MRKDYKLALRYVSEDLSPGIPGSYHRSSVPASEFSKNLPVLEDRTDRLTILATVVSFASITCVYTMMTLLNLQLGELATA
jgi:hypothetical protein